MPGYCNMQLRAYQTVLPEIHRYGGQLVAISPQTPDNSLTDVEVKQLTFPVLTDAQNRVARQYGLVYQLSDSLKALQTGFGNPIPKFNGDDSWELPMPGTFVLDRNGIVRLAHVDADYRHRLEPAELLESLEGYQLMKVAIVTGATSGIGRASALEFAKRGYHLVLASRNQSAGERFLEGDWRKQRHLSANGCKRPARCSAPGRHGA